MSEFSVIVFSQQEPHDYIEHFMCCFSAMTHFTTGTVHELKMHIRRRWLLIVTELSDFL
jgi:hypothetical protein